MASTSKSNKSWSFSPTDTISSAQVNTNFTEIHDYINDDLPNLYVPQSAGLINGMIVPSVDSNNLTVAIKQLDGTTDPSTTAPVYVNINGTVRAITSALSVTANAGTNWFKLGDREMATFATDLFVYLGYNAIDGVTIGFSRIPYVNIYSQFNTTNTNERFCKISTITNASANDVYKVIGKFEATLSAGTGFTWTVPTYTADNLIQRPVYETRNLIWVPTWTCSTGTLTSVTAEYVSYQIVMKRVLISYRAFGTLSNNTTDVVLTLPISTIDTEAVSSISSSHYDTNWKITISNSTGGLNNIRLNRDSATPFASGDFKYFALNGFYNI